MLGRFLWVLMDSGMSTDSSKCSRKQFAGQKLFWGVPSSCKHCSHQFQTHEGELLTGKRASVSRPNAFFFFLHEMSARRGRKEYIAIPCACKSKPGACPYTLDAQFYPPSALRSELLLSLMISFAKIQWAASAASHMDRRGLGRGGILRHKDNNIIPVTCGDLLLCLVASITLVSLHSICSGRLSFTLFQAAAASRTFWDYRRSPEGSYV